jgi:hypothetical protein
MMKSLKFTEWLNEEKGKFEISHAQFDELTEEMLKYAKKVLNSKGYNVYNFSKSSAMGDWTWFEGNPHDKRPPYNAPKVTLSGWHGTGSYGKGKMILSVFYSNLPGHRFTEVGDWGFPDTGETSEFSNRMMTAYTSEALDSYRNFLKEVKKLVDEAPKVN